MKRFCPFVALMIAANSVNAASLNYGMFGPTREDRLAARVAELESRLAKQSQPKLSVPEVTYRTETRYRSVPVYVKRCENGRCWYEWQYRQQAYTVQVAVASSQHVVTEPEAASTPMADVRRMVGMVALPAGSTVLDPGAGRDARVAIELARRGYSVLAFEIDGARYRSARKAIRDSGYGDRIRLVHGDCTKYVYDVDGVVAYLYPDTLASLAKRLKSSSRLRKFISYQHDVEGLAMVRSGDIRVWTRPTPQAVFTMPQPVPQRYAVWGGRQYAGRVCSNPNCSMCNSIQRQLGR